MRRIKSTLCLSIAALGLSSGAMQGQQKSFVRDYVADLGDRKIEVEGVCSISEDRLSCWKPNGESNPALQSEFEKFLTEKKTDYVNQFRFAYNKKNRVLVLKTTYLAKPDGRVTIGNTGVLQEQFSDSNSRNTWRSTNYLSTPTGDPRLERTEKRLLQGAFDTSLEKSDLPYFFNSPSQARGAFPLKTGPFTIDGNVYEILSITPREAQSYMGKVRKTTDFKIKLVKITDPDVVLSLSPANADGKQYAAYDSKNRLLLAEEYAKLMNEQYRRQVGKGSGASFGSIQQNMIYGMGIDPRSAVRPSTDVLTLQVNVELSKIKTLAASVTKRTTFDFGSISLDPKNP